MSQLPYRAEYAKSGRSACKGCKQFIENQTVRLAIMVQSSFFDGMQPNWYHMSCFFNRTRAKSVDEIAHFQSLRWADQEEIRSKIESALNGPPIPTKAAKGKGKGKGSKRTADTSNLPADLADYTVEYAKSNRSKCKVCEDTIAKGALRISKKEYESESAKKYGPCERWHHVDCFLRARSELGFLASGADLPGFMALEPDDQKDLKSKITPLASSAPLSAPSPPKKKKVDNDDKLTETMKRQNDAMYKIRDELQNIPKKDLIHLLEHNKQDVPEGATRILDRLSDAMAFGALNRCNKCSKGQLVFRSGVGYECIGYITDWTKCEGIFDKPARGPFKVPKVLKTAHPFLNSYQSKVDTRAFKEAVLPTTSQAVLAPKLPLSGLELFLHKSKKSAEEVKTLVTGLGGFIRKAFDPCVVAVISDPAETQKTRPLKAIKQAKEANVPVVTEDFLTSLTVRSTRDEVINVLRDKTCSPWGADQIEGKIPAVDVVDGVAKSVYPSKSSSAKSIFKSEMGVQKVTMKDGLVVDPDSKLASKARVYKNKNDIYSVVLSLTDLQTQKNSYYKLQVLVSDKGNRYYLFRSWGRIGTTIGGSKTEEYSTLAEACSAFETLFEEKSGNQWNARHNFVKVPGKLMMLDVVHGSGPSHEVKIDATSKLPMPVQELMTLIFDIKAMEATMLEFELDLNKMPLGKLSQNQITSAFSLLTELQRLRQDGADRVLIVDRTNRFYTLVPHDFGIDNPPVLDNDELINQKINMLNSLMDIEIAYKLLESATDANESPIDSHYKKLKTNISVLAKDTAEFEAIVKYVKNTHADTHRNYALVVQDVYKIDRDGESKRYKAFKKLPNKMLLWHGSRLTNFAGILSQGLRIAPPEAPVTGYMFGKGIYFADMVSKSANYCMTSSQNPTGLLLLCEVALGKMNELKQAQNVVKPPSGYHSVKGLGVTQPDPSDVGVTPGGAVIPFGKGKKSNVKGASLLYNEYIVYDVSQVNIQYLVRMHFKFGKN